MRLRKALVSGLVALVVALTAFAIGVPKPAAASTCTNYNNGIFSGYEYIYTLNSHVTVTGGAYLYAETILELPCGSNPGVGTFRVDEAAWDNNGTYLNSSATQMTAEAVMGTFLSNPVGPPALQVSSNGIEYYYLFSGWIPSYTANHVGCTNTYGPWASNPGGYAYVSGDGTKYTLGYNYIRLNYINCLTWDGSDPGISIEGH